MHKGTRRLFAVQGDSGVQILREAIPYCDDNHVVVATEFTMISPGTELHYIRQARETGETLELGYCAVGTVLRKGGNVDHTEPGDRVIAMGWRAAIHADCLIMPRRLVRRIPGDLPGHLAILSTLAATAVHAGDRSRLSSRDRVLVLGLGGVGMLMALLAADVGAEVCVWDVRADRMRGCPVWPSFDPRSSRSGGTGRFTKIYFCAEGDVTEQIGDILNLLHPDGNGKDRSMLVNLGRLSGRIAFSPASGNFDLINVSRCGAGYRDDRYHVGLADVVPPNGEARVDDNLERALALIDRQRDLAAALPRTVFSPRQALSLYRGEASFPVGFCLIRHGDKGENFGLDSD
ncbi:oxidoreductase [Brenneria corticis]|uniref:Oxidoreductase n=1 Tax=Brenneria corticis TaxID=2173106 RepID=A0A2U1TYV1_9GAMM|nr:oxidoreductase [Brenneria sp. CFCC 11842]PWC14564.1 oxidoreductase [Brenneria sp. CFCC 11842]